MHVVLMHRMIPFPRQPDEDGVDLFGCLASPLPELSDIMVKESNAADAALSPGGQSRALGEGCRWPLLQSSQGHCPHPFSCVSLHTEPASSVFFFFFTGGFRRWTKQPRTGARTMARCTAETVYQGHHVLRALNTPSVFSASLFLFLFFSLLPSLPLLLSGRILCWCSCLSLMPAKKSGRG